ncbi:insulinase family protein [Roseovarius sp. LXJ103]|uniref:M16 family metallopeptidase n=1 Tax=Roseovarius carneus TaxID=2853164 RepID=UPI000D6225BB|nr:pitrilysin family protein [Roseovarius carneus]MBZ8117867.1 insulinase family protein [Roseovarius carneus]PWE36373.1 peptidase M16 [Pelagicola sp. LXJ1103]
MIRFALACLIAFAALPARAEINVQELTSPGGTNVWLVEDSTIPFVALELRFRGGASLDADGKRGATNLMVGLLEEGAGDLDSRAFAEATEALAADFSYNITDDRIAISARFLSEDAEAAIALLRKSVVTPNFDHTSLDRVRAQILSIIASDLKNPSAIGAAAFNELVYGAHPYGSSENGTVESVTALTREDIQAAHAAAMTRDQLYVSAVGDIDAETLMTLVDKLTEGLPQSGAPLPGPADVNLPGGALVVPYDTPQSVVMFAQSGIERDDPDFFAAFILNQILGGGGFESRLMQEVREKRGLTYGVYSLLADKEGAQLMMGSVASANDRVAEAISVIKDEWTRLAKEGVSAEELADAKTYMTGAYPLRFDGNANIANIAVGMQVEGLPTDYIATRNDKVNAVTLEQINRVAAELLNPDQLTFVVVGQPEGLPSTIN